MLVLTRKKNEAIIINDDVVLTVVDIRGDKVRLGIAAPKAITVHRQEVYNAIKAKEASQPCSGPSSGKTTVPQKD